MKAVFLEFGEKLRILRESKGMTQEQLADKSGISRREIINIENGKYLPKMQTADFLAAALDVSLDELSTVIRKGDK